MKLTPEQQELVVQNLKLVDDVLYFRIKRNIKNPDHDLEDLRQVGRLGLCIAALHYDALRPFPAYAREVIWHQLIQYLKQADRHPPTISMDSELSSGQALGGILPDHRDVVGDAEERMNQENLRQLGDQYQGVIQKGIHAMALKLNGFTGADIAKLYHVPPNHVSAWIARAQTRLQQDKCFLKLVS